MRTWHACKGNLLLVCRVADFVLNVSVCKVLFNQSRYMPQDHVYWTRVCPDLTCLVTCWDCAQVYMISTVSIPWPEAHSNSYRHNHILVYGLITLHYWYQQNMGQSRVKTIPFQFQQNLDMDSNPYIKSSKFYFKTSSVRTYLCI